MAVTHGHGNPAWTRDETILALDLLFKLGKENPSISDKRIIQLSEQLNKLPIHPQEERKNHFRNPASVAFKIQNLKSVATGKGLTNVSNMDKIIWQEFGNKPKEVEKIAIEIIIESSLINEKEALIETVSEEETFVEGKIITATHKRIERDKNLRKTIINERKKNNKICCDICGIKPYFNESIEDCIIFECHHIVPLAYARGLRETKIEDIAFLCSNCHKAIHHRMAKEKRTITPTEMKNILRQNK